MEWRYSSGLAICSLLVGAFSFVSGANALSIDEFLGQGAAASTTQGVPATTVTVNASAVGGNRTLFALKSSAGSGPTTIETLADPEFVGDQDFSLGFTAGTTVGQGIVTWDGDLNGNSFSSNGLGSIDFTQDNGDTLLIALKYFDYPANQASDVTISLFDSLNPSARSEVRVTLNQSVTPPYPDSFILALPFSLFTTIGPNSVPAPNSSTFATNTSFGPGGSVNMTRIGAMQMAINGVLSASGVDFIVDYLKTNGRCNIVPNANGRVLDDCGVCLDSPNANQGQDVCGVCYFGPPDYQYHDGRDDCGLCPNAPNYGHAKDPCNVCFGDGNSCADCSGTPNGESALDQCGVCAGDGSTCLDCNGIPFGPSGVDACGVCGGAATSNTQCGACVTVEATQDVLNFEKRLLRQAKTIRTRFNADKARALGAQCGLALKPMVKSINTAFETIKHSGTDIFTKGIEVCGSSCVTVTYADQVEALSPQFTTMERVAKKLANKVKKCYQKKKGKYQGSGAGVNGTITNIRNGLAQIIRECRDKQVCPPGSH